MATVSQILRYVATMPDRIATCLVDLGDVSDSEEQSVLLLPTGRVDARDGRRWTNPDPAGVVDRSLAVAGATQLVVDYEHQTDLAGQNGQRAPAAGWITALTATAAGIRASIRWTEQALAHLRAREYRYISPVFKYDKAGRVLTILRAGLTNSPALDLPALASTRGGDTMHEKLLQLLAMFGLTGETAADEAALDTALAKAGALADAASAERTATAKALGLAEDADHEAVVAKATALAAGTINPGEYVPMGEFKAVAAQLKTLQDETAAAKATAAVDAAIRSGKVTPAQRDWALGYAKADPNGFTAYLAAQPVIVAPGARQGDNLPADPDAALSADELAVCTAMGLTIDQYKAGRKELLERAAGEQT